MHRFEIGKYTVDLNNFQVTALFALALSGIGMAGAGLLVIVDIIRWSLQ